MQVGKLLFEKLTLSDVPGDRTSFDQCAWFVRYSDASYISGESEALGVSWDTLRQIWRGQQRDGNRDGARSTQGF